MSYHEGSNWQAKKEDEKKPLYENPPTQKKKTPLQEAIEQTKKQLANLIEASEQINVNTEVAQQQLRVVITNLELLLPKEKEFAKEMWKKGKGDLMFHENKKSFEETYQQYKP